MKIQILGSGGAVTIPKPGCSCRVCTQARNRGIPYARSGPSLFIPGPDILFDTPEEIKEQLNRARIGTVQTCFYSHWHPDHVMGRRVWEMNRDWSTWPFTNRKSTVYLPEQVALDFRRYLGTWDHLAFLETGGLVELVTLKDGQSVTLEGIRIQPFRLAADYVYAFLLTEGKRRVLIALDELVGWTPPEELNGVDLAILPKGLDEFNLIGGERNLQAGHPLLEMEASFDDTLEIIRSLNPTQTVLTHIEEPDRLSFDDLKIVEKRLAAEGYSIRFACDTMTLEV